MSNPDQKDHELGINIVCQYLQKDGATIKGANPDMNQHPQVVAEIDGQLHFVSVRTVRYPNEAVLDPALKAQLQQHATQNSAVLSFAPVGLWPTGDKNEAGEEGFHVKYHGIQRVEYL